jgi:peptidoglycan hydrolase CwlO-like protein
MRKLRFFTTVFFWTVFALATANFHLVRADDCESYVCASIENDDERAVCVDKKVACYQKKINESQGQQKTLSGDIANIEYRVRLQEAQIEQTKLDIIRAKKEIAVLADRIDNLGKSLEKLTLLLAKKVDDSYRQLFNISDLEVFLASQNVSRYAQEKTSEKIVAHQTSVLLFKAMEQKNNYDEQKTDKEKLQVELEEKTLKLEQQQKQLEQEKENKAILLAQTKNDEKQYQRLLEDARKEADAFKRFAANAGGSSCLSSSPGGGEGGWFYSQRDPRWCKQYVGGSNMTVGEVGCYLTTVAMIFKRHGVETSPARIAANNNYFFSNTALMLTPPAPPGFTYKRVDYVNLGTVDNELSNDRPVVVHVRTNNGYGGHFIVLKSGSDGDYIMNDPWYGADLAFSKYYSTGQIDSLRLFTK